MFTYIPIANMLCVQLRQVGRPEPDAEFVGLDNYVEVFTRPELFGVFFTSLYYFVGAFVQMAIALYLATMLSFKIRFRNLFKGIIFFPYLINGVAISFIFLYVLQPDGVLDSLLARCRRQRHPAVAGRPRHRQLSLASVSVWRYLGLNFVLFLGRDPVDPVRDAGGRARSTAPAAGSLFRHIIVPGIRPVIGLSFILAIAGSLSVFEIPYIMLGGANGSATFVIQTVQTAFNYHKFGLASAMAVVLLVLILFVTWIQRRLVPDEQAELI